MPLEVGVVVEDRARRRRAPRYTIGSSCGSRPSLRSVHPACRSPNTSPAPRMARSRSASSKPSPDSRHRLHARLALGRASDRRAGSRRDACAPRPMRPRSWWSCSRPKRSASSIDHHGRVRARRPRPRSRSSPRARRSSPARNARIAASLSAGGIWPCSRPSRRPASSSAREPLELLGGGPRLELVGAFDERAHDVGLAPVRHLARAPARTPRRARAGRGPPPRSRSASGPAGSSRSSVLSRSP